MFDEGLVVAGAGSLVDNPNAELLLLLRIPTNYPAVNTN